MSVTNYVDGPLGGTPLNAANLNRDFNNRPAKWQPNTGYVGGGVDLCISPNGDVVTCQTSHTSGTSYDATKWALSTTYAPAQQSPNMAALVAFNNRSVTV